MIKNNYFSLISLISIVISLFFDGSVIGFSLILLFLLGSFLSKSIQSILLTGILLHAFIFYLLGDVYSSNTSAGLWLQLFDSWISAIIFVSRLAFLNPKIDITRKESKPLVWQIFIDKSLSMRYYKQPSSSAYL